MEETNMNVDEYNNQDEAPSEHELATGAVTEGNMNINMNNEPNNKRNNEPNNKGNNKPNNKLNNKRNNKPNNNGFLSQISTSLIGNNKGNNTAPIPNNGPNKEPNNGPTTVNNVNANMIENEEPISYSREDELVTYGKLNGLEPANLASRYHNIFEGEKMTRKRQTRKQKSKARKQRRQTRKQKRQARKRNARHK
jgi:hypothetical protein